MSETSSVLMDAVIIRQLGLQPYDDIWHKMQAFTDNRTKETKDEIWLVEHPSVFTQGQAGKAEHLLQMSQIPVVQSDRGGQITYHGPGQLVMYVLIDIKRKKAEEIVQRAVGNNEICAKPTALNVRQLVTYLEQSVVDTLGDFGIKGYPKADAPGVYVAEQKICSLGLRIRRGCSFHGLALNINMDLSPFQQINPCGYAGLQMCQLSELISQFDLTCAQVAPYLIQHFTQLLHYTKIEIVEGF